MAIPVDFSIQYMFPRRNAGLFSTTTALIHSVIHPYARVALKPFSTALGRSLRVQGFLWKEGSHADASSVPWIEKSTATDCAVQDDCAV
jgi:hypothetical protein